jgi:hypothetical protein
MEINKLIRQVMEGSKPSELEGVLYYQDQIVEVAKLVAEKAIAKDREEFDIDELCARQNKIGYKQGYRAGQLAEREACALICGEYNFGQAPKMIQEAIRARGEE